MSIINSAYSAIYNGIELILLQEEWMTAAFVHRTLLGWISEFVNRPLPGVWPQIPLDDETIGDFEDYFDLCRDCGYNEVVIWGFFVDRRWPIDVASCVDEERRERIYRVLEAGHVRGLEIHSGLGLYSWGFDAIIETHPELSRTNRVVMCPSVPEAREWMERVVDFVMEFPFDGLNMQSADNGRCECEDCKELSTIAYHARLNAGAARYIHGRWPGKRLIVDNWGCPFSDPEGLSYLAAMGKDVGYVIDHNNSASEAGEGFRRRLAQALDCPFGTLAGRSVWPPQRWPQHRWFLPTTLVNVEYVKGLYADGGRAAEQFVTSLANPSGEVTLRFMGKLLADVEGDAEGMLRAAVKETYEPRDEVTLDGLVEVVRDAEEAYFGNADVPEVGLFYVDGGLTCEQEPNPAVYLERMSEGERKDYARGIAECAAIFAKIEDGIGQRGKAELTARCLQTVREEAERLER